MADSLVTDGTNNFLGGQDASKFPALVPPDSFYAGVNLTIQNGVPTPRWGLDKKPLQLPTEDIDVGNNVLIPYSEVFKTGRYQAIIPYSIGPDKYLVIVIAGIMYLVNIDTYKTTVLSLPNNDTLNENTPRLNWSNADNYIVIFDYPNFPVILDGITVRRADPALYEVPVSVLGAYNQNRLFIANAGNEFTAGDPVGSLATPDAPITFEEVEAPAAAYFGQIFKLPTNTFKSNITAMTFLEFTDTSTSIGPLIIATDRQIFSYNSQNPRSTWDTIQFGTAMVSTGGIAGPRAFTHINSDMFYLGADGQVRTLYMSRNEQKKWSQVPLSREVINWLKYNDPKLIPFSVMGNYKNKVLVTVNPHRVVAYTRNRTPTFDVSNGGFAVLELDNLATLGKDTPPTWPGLWTGVRPMDIVTTDGRCFVISKDESSVNALYEFNPDTTYDTDNGIVRYVKSRLYTREYDFQSPFINKNLHSIDLGVRNVQGDFKITVDYKPSHGNKFIEWATFSHDAPWRSCTPPSACAVNGLGAHNFRDLTLGNPVDPGCDPVSSLTYESFRKVQLRFTIEGKYWELHEYLLKAIPMPQGQQVTACNQYKPVELCNECNKDWEIGAFESCLIQKT